MASPLQDKYVVLGVTGSIAAYKAADLASKLTQAGARVDTVLTEAATRFVSPLTFQSVTGRPAYTDANLWGAQAHVLHVGLGHQADLIVIAPATAQTMAKLAHGLADNLLTLTVLAAACPVLIAPAMDGGMFGQPATQANVRVLSERGMTIVGPEEGHLASGLKARGRMTEPLDLLGHIRYRLSRGGPLAGRRVIVTAGGTQEPVDPVRVLTNRSSGKQGLALAQAALDAGADVTLIAAPMALPVPVGVQHVAVGSAAEMAVAVLDACRKADVLLMAAAVADFTPVDPAGQKIKKDQGPPLLALRRTADILSEVAVRRETTGYPLLVAGFAAETENLLANAQAKLRAKQLDLLVANDVSAVDAGFGVDTNRVTLLDARGAEELPLLSKADVAARVVERVIQLMGPNTAPVGDA